jgi:hypothetical protein
MSLADLDFSRLDRNGVRIQDKLYDILPWSVSVFFTLKVGSLPSIT